MERGSVAFARQSQAGSSFEADVRICRISGAAGFPSRSSCCVRVGIAGTASATATLGNDGGAWGYGGPHDAFSVGPTPCAYHGEAHSLVPAVSERLLACRRDLHQGRRRMGLTLPGAGCRGPGYRLPALVAMHGQSRCALARQGGEEQRRMPAIDDQHRPERGIWQSDKNAQTRWDDESRGRAPTSEISEQAVGSRPRRFETPHRSDARLQVDAISLHHDQRF